MKVLRSREKLAGVGARQVGAGQAARQNSPPGCPLSYRRISRLRRFQDHNFPHRGQLRRAALSGFQPRCRQGCKTQPLPDHWSTWLTKQFRLKCKILLLPITRPGVAPSVFHTCVWGHSLSYSFICMNWLTKPALRKQSRCFCLLAEPIRGGQPLANMIVLSHAIAQAAIAHQATTAYALQFTR